MPHRNARRATGAFVGSTLLSVACLVSTAHAQDSTPAKLRLPHVFGDHMVVQRDMPVAIWGQAAAGATVTVRWQDAAHVTVAHADGGWQVVLPATSASKTPTELVIQAGDETRTIHDVLVGEVWLCSGQSNMEWPTRLAQHGDEEVAAADQPLIRLLRVPHAFAAKPQSDIDAEWQVCAPATVGDFSAVGYFLGRNLATALDVPIGLIESAVGGTQIEPWMPRAAYGSKPPFTARLAQQDAAAGKFEALTAAQRETQAQEALADYEKRVAAYWQALEAIDPGFVHHWMRGNAAAMDSDANTLAWQPYPLSVTWEDSGIAALRDFDGSVWFRTMVEIPQSWAGCQATLHLPAIDDSDTTFFDDVQIGRSMWQWSTPRNYAIPAELLTPGRHTITIEMLDFMAGGGFTTPVATQKEILRLTCTGQTAALPVLDWEYRIAAPLKDLPTAPPQQPQPQKHPAEAWTSPTSLYNGMIAPLVPYALRGAIWYQGESNAAAPAEYRELLPMLIDGWRKAWKAAAPMSTAPPMAFGVVQLANFGAATPDQPAPGKWAWLREAQVFGIRGVQDTGLVVIIDIGDAADIHPRNKQEVGRRLALWAQAEVYGANVAYSGPVFRKAEVRDGAVVLHFDHTAGGLKTLDGKPLAEFAIAGADQKFVWAQAQIEGDTVVVRAPEVPDPVAVRYAWASNPAHANLANAAGLPASPFRTDDWPVE